VEIVLTADSIDVDRREEFGRLAAAEWSASYRLATRILGNLGDAEDAVNEAVLKAWSSFGRLRDTDSFRPWLTRIVVNQCRNQLRRGKIVQIEPLIGDNHPAADSFEGGQLRDVVARAIDCLGPDQRIVVVLRYWNDLAVDEIGRVLGVPSGTVKWRLHAANQHIKTELSRLGWEVEQ
jgi:RNA polymerase sigma-70 factor (ECF subfamily)